MKSKISMLRQLSVFLFFSILVLACQSKGQPNQAETEQVFEEIIVNRYSVSKGNKDSMALSSFIQQTYNDKGQEKKAVYYASDSSIMMQFVNLYDGGNKSQVDWVNGNDVRVKYVKMTYNEDNRLIRSETYDTTDNFISGFIHQWKDSGTTEEKGPIEDGEFRPNAIYTYNAQQEMESLVEFDDNDSLYARVNWKYISLDSNSEWTEREMILNDTLVRVEKRKIKYRKNEN